MCICPGYIWAEDKEHCEEYGRMLQADPSKVSMRAKKRGLPQVSDDKYVLYNSYFFGTFTLSQKCVTNLWSISSPHTDRFLQFFSHIFSRKFVVKLLLKFAPCLKCIAALPCEIFML